MVKVFQQKKDILDASDHQNLVFQIFLAYNFLTKNVKIMVIPRRKRCIKSGTVLWLCFTYRFCNHSFLRLSRYFYIKKMWQLNISTRFILRLVFLSLHATIGWLLCRVLECRVERGIHGSGYNNLFMLLELVEL